MTSTTEKQQPHQQTVQTATEDTNNNGTGNNNDPDVEGVTKATPPLKEKEDEPTYPKGLALALIMTAVWVSLFLVALDRTILATAVPKITDQFHSLSDVGWYGSSYMLTNCSTQLIFGRIYKFYNTKWVLLACIGIFEVGSALCGAAPNSKAFIIGRSVAGLGSAGIFSGGLLTLFHTVPLHKRPVYAGLFGATFGIASVIGPLLGGVFTDKVTWRWCFYINIPIGVISFAIILVALKLPNPKDVNLSIRQQLAQLDPLGTICFLPAMVCLVLALQWGGTTYAWSSWRLVLLLTLFSVLIVIFGGIQIIKGDSGTLPPRILLHRSIASGAWFTFCTASSMMIVVYYLPIYFQAVKGTSAFESGLRMIPTVLSLVVSSILSGQFTSRIGYYVPGMLVCPVVASIGAGMITTLNLSSGHAMWIGYQVLFGFGLGLGMQVPTLAVQAVLPRDDVSIGTAIMFFSQQLGGALFVSVAQNVFINDLVKGLSGVPGLSAMSVVNTGATDLQKTVPAKYLPEVLGAYNYALTRTFVIATAMMAASVFGSVAMEWKNIKKGKKPAGGPPAKAEEHDRKLEVDEKIDTDKQDEAEMSRT